MVYNFRMIDRTTDVDLVRAALKRSRVVAILGPRQCGKTTLARQFLAADSLNYFDLEDPSSLARLSEPDLPDVAIAYTRKVTLVWCAFFLVNGGIALATALWGTEAQWTLYNGGIAYVLMGLIAAVEWLVRKRVRGQQGVPNA